MHNANLPPATHTPNSEVASRINRSIRIRIRRRALQRITRKPLLRTQTIARINVILLHILIPLLAIQPPHHKREPADQNRASDTPNHAPDDFLRVRAQIAAVAACVRERGRDRRGGEAGRALEDVFRAVDRAVDLAVARPGGGEGLVPGGFGDERFADGGFVCEGFGVDGGAADFDDAVVRAFGGLYGGVGGLVGGEAGGFHVGGCLRAICVAGGDGDGGA